ELGNLAGQFDGHLAARLMHGAIPGAAKPDEVVILRHDLAGGTREVDGQRGHCPAKVIDFEDQVFVEIGWLAPNDPAYAGIDQAVLVPRGVDGLDARQAEVPDEFGLDDRSDEAAACAIDMDRNIESGPGLKRIERCAQLLDILIMTGEG